MAAAKGESGGFLGTCIDICAGFVAIGVVMVVLWALKWAIALPGGLIVEFLDGTRNDPRAQAAQAELAQTYSPPTQAAPASSAKKPAAVKAKPPTTPRGRKPAPPKNALAKL
jgi:hypothetical protein